MLTFFFISKDQKVNNYPFSGVPVPAGDLRPGPGGGAAVLPAQPGGRVLRGRELVYHKKKQLGKER